MFISDQRSVFFGPVQGSGPREITDQIFFPRPVKSIVSGISGFSASLSSEEGRPFGRLVVELLETSFT